MHATLASSLDSRAGNDRAERWQIWSRQPGAIHELCDALIKDRALDPWVEEHDFSHSTVIEWIADDPARASCFERAKKALSRRLAIEIVIIADEAVKFIAADPHAKGGENRLRLQWARMQIVTRRCLIRELRPARRESRPRTNRKGPTSLRDQLLGRQTEEEKSLEMEASITHFPEPNSASGHTEMRSGTLRAEAGGSYPPTSAVQPLATPPSITSGQDNGPESASAEPQAVENSQATKPSRPLPTISTAKIVGRNERCPCGSGKKFKKCCG